MKSKQQASPCTKANPPQPPVKEEGDNKELGMLACALASSDAALSWGVWEPPWWGKRSGNTSLPPVLTSWSLPLPSCREEPVKKLSTCMNLNFYPLYRMDVMKRHIIREAEWNAPPVWVHVKTLARVQHVRSKYCRDTKLPCLCDVRSQSGIKW